MILSHVDENGNARMVDVSEKKLVRREAWASGTIMLKPATLDLIKKNLIKKGDVLLVANIAGISAAKKTAELIPLCHQINIDQVVLDFKLSEDRIDIHSHARCTDRTGIEMEVLTAVSVAALTIYDMCKAVDDAMTITDIRLDKKQKADSGR